MLPVAVAWSSSFGLVICYVLPVLFMTSYLHMPYGCLASPPSRSAAHTQPLNGCTSSSIWIFMLLINMPRSRSYLLLVLLCCFDVGLLSRTEDFLDFVDIVKPPYISPQCADHVDLEFSIHAFEHLEVSFEAFVMTRMIIVITLMMKSVLVTVVPLSDHSQ